MIVYTVFFNYYTVIISNTKSTKQNSQVKLGKGTAMWDGIELILRKSDQRVGHNNDNLRNWRNV